MTATSRTCWRYSKFCSAIALGFQGPALGDLAYRGERLANIGETLGVTVEAITRGRDGRFVPAGICWVVERSFAWLARLSQLAPNSSSRRAVFCG
jgi:hypothetical protein